MTASLAVLIAGRSGQLATELCPAFTAAGHRVVSIGRPDLNLQDPASIARCVREAKPDVVINAAAYTAVDTAEDEPDKAHTINAVGAGHLASAADGLGVPIIHISTDYVFDGTKSTPYLEHDATAPLGVYGSTKLAGEHLVAQANRRHIVIRTAWVFSPQGQNFAKTMLRLGAERSELAVVDDQFGSPTSAANLADVIAEIAVRIQGAAPGSPLFGTYHATCQNTATWYSFARAIMAGAARRGAKHAAVRPIPTEAYPTRAKRPAYSVLDTSKLKTTFGIGMRPWQDELDRCLDTLIGARGRSD